MRRLLRAAPLLVAICAFYTPAKAEPVEGLNVDVYRWYNEADGYAYPPQRLENPTLCEGAQTFSSDIDYEWGGGPIAGCDNDRVVVHFYGTITVPVSTWLIVQHDDGGALFLDGQPYVDAWWDTGCAWDYTWVEAGTYEIDFWFYENGGWACAKLWQYDEQTGSYGAVPAAWFSTQPPETTTTSTSTTTTTSSTTTETPTTIVEETTTIPAEPTTTWAESTSTTTIEPTTVPIESVPATTTEAPTTTQPETTVATTTPRTTPPTPPPSNTTAPPVESSVPSQTSSPASTNPETSAPTETEPVTVPGTTPSSSEPVTIPPADTSVPPDTTPTSVPPAESTTSIIDVEQASNEELANYVAEQGFENISSDEAEAIIDAIDFGELSDEETAAVVEALNEAPDEVKATFENKVNVYSGQFDSYVPKGSVLTVGQRRTLIVATSTVATVMPTSNRRKGLKT